MDPELENRFVGADRSAHSVNVERIVASFKESELEGRRAPLARRVITEPDFGKPIFSANIEPTKRYLLAFRLEHVGYDGELQLKRPGLFPDILKLPESDVLQIVPIWATGSEPSEVSLWVAGRCRAATCSMEFIPECFMPYSTRDLPIRMRSLMPYRVDVNADGATNLESYRMYLPGYVAKVNGRPADVLRSPEGNAMVAIPAGQSEVELDYVGTVPMRIGWWVSLFAWVGVLGFLLYGIVLRWVISPGPRDRADPRVPDKIHPGL